MRKKRKMRADDVAMTLRRYRTVDLHYPSGEPLRAGDMKSGTTVVFDLQTGVVSRIGNRRMIRGKTPNAK